MSNYIKITLENKPNLRKALRENPNLAKEVIQTFVDLAEEAFDETKVITWAELPKLFSKDLSFRDLIRGILRGSLDLKDINPDIFDVIKEEVHPLAMLMPRKNWETGGLKYYEWRNHFRLPMDAPIAEETISAIFRKLLRYARYVDVQKLQQALEANQIASYRGIGERQVALLPFLPALKYQRERLGELQVGKFFDEVGFFDCGEIDKDREDCPACHDKLKWVTVNIKGCLKCNAGFKALK